MQAATHYPPSPIFPSVPNEIGTLSGVCRTTINGDCSAMEKLLSVELASKIDPTSTALFVVKVIRH